jgi:tRNA (mo5U34)-methyltransferase
LVKIKNKARIGMLLDTHYATHEMLNSEYESNGKSYKYYRHKEGGRDEVFSGMQDHAKWLLLQDIIDLLLAAGFEKFSIEKNELQRNGPRVRIYFQ